MVHLLFPAVASVREARRRCVGLKAAYCPASSVSLLVLCGALSACSSTQTGIPLLPPADPVRPGGAAPPAVVGSAWDNFNHRGAVMWACRDLASGDIVSTSMCYGLTKDDRHWPGMAVPPSFRGMPDP